MANPVTSLARNAGSTPVARALGRRLGLPQPATLRRGRTAPAGPVVLGVVEGHRGVEGGGAVDDGLAAATLQLLGVGTTTALRDSPAARTLAEDGTPRPPGYDTRLGAVVLDARAVTTLADLEQLRAMLRPALRCLGGCARVVVLGADTDALPGRAEVAAGEAAGRALRLAAGDVEQAAAQQGLEGIVRSVAKELRSGATANLVRVGQETSPALLASTLSFLLEGRSAYVSGQPWRVGPMAGAPAGSVVPAVAHIGTAAGPLAARVVVVTGAARGIGAAIARTLARDGGELVLVDVPAAGQALSAVANEVGGTALQLDITDPEAGARIAGHVAARHGGEGRIHALVHNAGITRDKLLVNTDEDRWAGVLEVNALAPMRISETLLDPWLPGGLAEEGRIVGVASTSGIAGNRGQSSYAASKAAVIGAVRALAPRLREQGRGITVNAVAPGFIETEMTGRMPLVPRELGRRLNSLQQGGHPVDVAETIGYLTDPASAAVTGQVIRVCGQSLLGA